MHRFLSHLKQVVLLALLMPFENSLFSASPAERTAEQGYYAVARVGADVVAATAGRSLLHSEQFLAFQADSKRLAATDVLAQARDLLGELDRELGLFGASLQQSMRLHVCIKDPAGRLAVEHALSERLGVGAPPVAYVVSDLPVREALVGIDAVAYVGFAAAVRHSARFSPVNPRPGIHGARHAVLPPGRAVFVSGQAVKGQDVGESAGMTLEQLGRTLADIECGWTNVVQIKTFLPDPSGNVERVREALKKTFGVDANRLPPQVYVEWNAAAHLLEIELVVDGGAAVLGAAAVEYLNPAGLPTSPVFSRIVRTNGGKLIYTGGISGAAGQGATDQLRTVFEGIKSAVGAHGGDMRHLVKATYYVSSEGTGRALNEIRRTLYDSDRPPAASKAMVRGIGLDGIGVSVDMIAVAPERP